MNLTTNRISYTYIYNTTSSKKRDFNAYPWLDSFCLLSSKTKQKPLAHFTFLLLGENLMLLSWAQESNIKTDITTRF